MDIEKSLEILKHREDYVFSNSDMDEAIKVAVQVMEHIVSNKCKCLNNLNDIQKDKIIDKFLDKMEDKRNG